MKIGQPEMESSGFDPKADSTQITTLKLGFTSFMRFLGVNKLPLQSQRLIQKFLFILNLQSSLFIISSTFYVLFVIDRIGFGVLGMLLAISFITQAILDYPTGVIGDWIGQRWSLAIAFCGYGLSYSVIIHATSLTDFLFVYLLNAFANSQQSGALRSWFDNNYKVSVGTTDSDRKTYRELFGKQALLSRFLTAAMIILGGVTATVFFRELLFIVQAFGLFGLALLCLILVKDYPEITKPELSFRRYFGLLGEGLRFSFGSKHMLFFVVGVSITSITLLIWGNMILFPMYFGYTGSDGVAAFIRFSFYVLTGFTMPRAGKWSKNLNARKWIPRLRLIHTVLFYGSFILIFTIFPFENRLNLLAIVITGFTFLVTECLLATDGFLRQRLLVDVVPDTNRNSVYSLLPTLSFLVSAPFIFISGNIIELVGVPSTLIVLMLLGFISSGFFFLSLRSLPKGVLKEEGE
ncbi:MAG: hypothetical protein ACW991_04350 [Candidatus Hodarchaeales archaeon]|jgi:hypothetical protein